MEFLLGVCGRGAAAQWLECDTVLELGGGRKGERRRKYQEYVENAVREGLKQSPWESLREQVVLGGTEFLAQVKKDIHGHEQEQRGARRLIQERPGLKSVIGAVEQVKGERWEAFRDRHGDPARDMVLYLGRHVCGLKLSVAVVPENGFSFICRTRSHDTNRPLSRFAKARDMDRKPI